MDRADRKPVINGKPRHLGAWRLNTTDLRDHTFRGVAASATPQQRGYVVAESSDLSSIMPAVYDQGDIGSCTANGWCTVQEALRAKRGLPALEFSRLQFYYGERVFIQGVPPGEDSGSQIRDGAKFLTRYGCCPESLWPYLPDKFAESPPQQSWDVALGYQALRYYSLGSLEWIKACLTLGFPAVFGFSVPKNFIEQTGETGQLLFPTREESYSGGHCCVAYGHDDNHLNEPGDQGAFRVRNSWGINWGLEGDFWMPYRFHTAWLATDFTTLHDQESLEY